MDKEVFFVCPPGLDTVLQQKLVRELIDKEYAESVQYIDLGNTVSLKDTAMSFDGMHLTPKGNENVATIIHPYIQKAIQNLK